MNIGKCMIVDIELLHIYEDDLNEVEITVYFPKNEHQVTIIGNFTDKQHDNYLKWYCDQSIIECEFNDNFAEAVGLL